MREFLERIGNDPVYFAYRFIGYGLVIFLLVAILGCAPRYLTPEEEAQMKEVCGE